jgi:putative transposase
MIERSYALPVKRQAQAVGFSRRVLSWRLSITLETDFCVEAIEEALMRFGRPDIFKTDQGSQFTSIAFTSVLLREKIAISMDGKGAWRHNVIIERLWRSVKYEEVYPSASCDGCGSPGPWI